MWGGYKRGEECSDLGYMGVDENGDESVTDLVGVVDVAADEAMDMTVDTAVETAVDT